MALKQAKLVLENGVVMTGSAFGYAGDAAGEVVFNTGMSGYQELLTDPSYCTQIVVMTYPLIGNYGINRDDWESIRPFAHGFVVREFAEIPSHWRSKGTLDDFLKQHEIPGISGVDTRKLTRMIREHGTLKGLITTSEEPDSVLLERLAAIPRVNDQVKRVSVKRIYRCPGSGPRIVLVDFGMKQGILRELLRRGCDVTVAPYDIEAEEIRRIHPDGIVLSNGPGDPKDIPQAAEMVKGVIDDIPLFGICLGHQLFALACGADTEKMKFGHRGSNHPVKNVATGKVDLTSQNHGYAVTFDSVKGTELEITHVALNDGTVEGLRHKSLPAFSVQYHPEASPGPQDTNGLFDEFLQQLNMRKKGGKQHA